MKYSDAIIMIVLLTSTISYGENVITQSSGLYTTGDTESVEIRLSQSNDGTIEGDGNTLVQSNDANICNYGTGIITMVQRNTKAIVGDLNTVYQINYALAENSGTNSSITQTQENTATIIGDMNYMDQNNNAFAGIQGESNCLNQSQENVGLLDGGENDLRQANSAISHNEGSKNCVSQIENNLAVISGSNEVAKQNNSQIAYPDKANDDDYDGIGQDACNIITMIGYNDSSLQNNYQNGSQEEYSNIYIGQSARNNGTLCSAAGDG